MAVVIGFSHHLIDMIIWGVVSLVTQLLIFFVISRILFRGIEARIGNNCNASGLFVGGVGIALLIHLSRLLYSRTVPGPSDGGKSRDVGPYRACSIPA